MNVKEIRAITGLTQSKFAEKYGLNKRTLQNWEGGANRPPQGLEKLLLRAVMEDKEREDMRKKQMMITEPEQEPEPAATETKSTISRTEEKELFKKMKESLEEIEIVDLYCENCINGEECNEDYQNCDYYNEKYKACDCIQNWKYWEILERMAENG